KTGVFTGGYAVNPVNGQKVPVWVADYVMMGYGTGAIMAVPAHDERDFAFAKKFDLPIRCVVMPPDDSYYDKNHAQEIGILQRDLELRNAGTDGSEAKQAAFDEFFDIQLLKPFCGKGVSINSSVPNDGLVPTLSISGQQTDDAKDKIIRALTRRNLGSPKINYKLRDWLFSRQRYWGEPFPILHGPDGEIRTVDVADLPVELPEMDDFKPTGSDNPDAPPQPPLGRASDDWKHVTIDGVKYQRELNTMPNWAGSCWYYLRYLDNRNNESLVGKDAEAYWMVSEKESGGQHAGGVDLYVGGAEHAVLHLLYARFWHKFLHDIGVASTPEPFGRYFAQGYIQAYCYRDERGMPVEAAKVTTTDGKPAAETQGSKGTSYAYEGQPVTEEFGKMGKSLKNAIGPETVCEDFGCDTLRLYEMYMGPLEQSKVWNTADIVGVHRFLNRLWRVVLDEETGKLHVADTEPDEDLNRKVHSTIKRVTEAMEGMHFNVAIAALIELNNTLVGQPAPPRAAVEALVRLLNPIAPHVAEELWAKLGHTTFLADTDWPTWDENALKVDAIEMPIQVNGKLRGKVMVPVDADNDAIEALAKQDANVAEHLEGKAIRKVIVVPKKLINLVVG
ncbi:MAG: class I tRNA ligase family protein, partial [Phycisphaerales bacterium JB063]